MSLVWIEDKETMQVQRGCSEEREGMGCRAITFFFLALESILAKRYTRTGEDPEINQIQTRGQAKQDDWPEKTGRTALRKQFDCLLSGLLLPGGTPTPLLSGCVSLPCFCLNCTVSLHALPLVELCF